LPRAVRWHGRRQSQMKYRRLLILQVGIVIAFLGSVTARAQEESPPGHSLPQETSLQQTATVASQDTNSSSTSGNSIYVPLTLKGKWLYSVSQIFGPSRLVRYALHTMVDYGFDLPKQWNRSGESVGLRLASNFGDSFVRHNIQFAVQALDHEDPRYFRSSLHGGFRRTRYAILHSFAVRKDDQSWMPAYSLLIADFGTPYIVSQWRPDRFHALDRLQSGTMGLGVAMGSNIVAEFMPDIKQRLSRVLAFSRH